MLPPETRELIYRVAIEFGLPQRAPEGFRYQAGFLADAEAGTLTEALARLSFEPFQFRGYDGRRRVISFGWKYDFTGPG